ncbi:MAG: glycosyltransferase, partial [Gammaproteobacteria bacterium]|nr:glycosyltransferase [Gammaproteobacteria bacterium]
MTTLWPPAMEPRAETLAASRPAALDGQSGSGVDATLCIALVVERFQPARGGLEHWAWQFACWLRDGGHSVHIITFAVDGAVERSGFRVHRLSSPATPLARADAVARFLTGTRFDIVHDTGLGWCADVFQPHGGSRFADFEQSQRARSPAARLGFLLRPSTHRRMAEYRELARRRLGRPALVLALSARVRDDLRRHDRLPEQQIR